MASSQRGIPGSSHRSLCMEFSFFINWWLVYVILWPSFSVTGFQKRNLFLLSMRDSIFADIWLFAAIFWILDLFGTSRSKYRCLFVGIDGLGVDPIEITAHLQRPLMLVVDKNADWGFLFFQIGEMLDTLCGFNLGPNKEWFRVLNPQILRACKLIISRWYYWNPKHPPKLLLVYLKKRLILDLLEGEQFYTETVVVVSIGEFTEYLRNFEGLRCTRENHFDPFSAMDLHYLDLVAFVQDVVEMLGREWWVLVAKKVCRLRHVHVYIQV